MGQLEIEHTFNELVCEGKKQYVGMHLKDLNAYLYNT